MWSESPYVLFEDERILALYKPSGMAVHRGWSRDPVTLVDWLRERTGDAAAYPVGRLDRGTSGVVLFARDAEGARLLQQVLGHEATRKTYLALVRGEPEASGVIDHPLRQRPDSPPVDAVTRYELLETAATQPRQVSLVLAHPTTGRLHQIRRHLKHINHPVLGDANYGRTELNRAFRQAYGLERLALHAASLTLRHPDSGDFLTVTAPLPDDLSGPLERMGFSLGWSKRVDLNASPSPGPCPERNSTVRDG